MRALLCTLAAAGLIALAGAASAGAGCFGSKQPEQTAEVPPPPPPPPPST